MSDRNVTKAAWWKSERVFPLIAQQLSCRGLVIPATSKQSERPFALAGLATKKRNALRTENAMVLLFLH
ncbi:unnamed protein product, partial [Sphacelaria rigidula]